MEEKKTETVMSDVVELKKVPDMDSTCLRSALSLDVEHCDLHDLIDEVKNLIILLPEFKSELEEDLCNIIGQNCDRRAMDYYNILQANGTAVIPM